MRAPFPFLSLIQLTLILTTAPEAPPKTAKKLEAAKAADRWEGIYAVAGRDSQKGYSGVVVVKKLADSGPHDAKGIYLVHWCLLDYSMVGIGTTRGGALIVAWSLATMRGMHIAIRDDKGAACEWISLPSNGKSNPERWTYLGPLAEPMSDLKPPPPDEIQ